MLNTNQPAPTTPVALHQRLLSFGKNAVERLHTEVAQRFPQSLSSRLPQRVSLSAKPLARAPQLPVAAPPPRQLLAIEIERLPDEQRFFETPTYAVYGARAWQMPRLLDEIGRLRELTFRQVGEGTGQATDLDAFDDYYEHLFVWNKEQAEVVGAYRLGRADRIVKRFGKKGLYTQTLFKYKKRLFDRLGPALELGRSFVRAEYQKTPAALFLLWKGIGQFIVRNPQYRVLFGPVSISNDYTPLSRQVMVEYLRGRNQLPELAKLVKARNPFLLSPRPAWQSPLGRPRVDAFDGFDGIEEVSRFVSAVEADNKPVPVLLRHYLKLGAQALAFNVDANFCDSLDALIVVDLCAADRRMLEKLMGERAARLYASE